MWNAFHIHPARGFHVLCLCLHSFVGIGTDFQLPGRTDQVPPSLFSPSLYIQNLFSRVQCSSFDVKFMQSFMDTFLWLSTLFLTVGGSDLRLFTLGYFEDVAMLFLRVICFCNGVSNTARLMQDPLCVYCLCDWQKVDVVLSCMK